MPKNPPSGPFKPIIDPNPSDPSNPTDPTDPNPGGNPPTGCQPYSCEYYPCPNNQQVYVDIDAATQCPVCKCRPNGPQTPIISPY